MISFQYYVHGDRVWHIVFSKDGKKIVATRIYLQIMALDNSLDNFVLMPGIIDNILAKYRAKGYDVNVFDGGFYYLEQVRYTDTQR